MEARGLRDRDAIATDLVGVAGLVALVVGLVLLQDSKNLGFDPAKALDGVLSQLAVTLPAAILVLGATVLDLAGGLVLARAARRGPFDSRADALVAAMVAAVLKDTLLLGTLAAFGLFRAPELIAVNLALVAAVWLPSLGRHLRPLTAFAGWRESVRGIGSGPVAALVGIVWIGPVILQLASPVVPFIDVLPNYVGPVEHLRTFGWFSPLTETQSPIIGPSRTVLGYDALLGSLATMTNLSGGLAIAGFILPQTVLVGAAVHRLAAALRGSGAPIGPWALLAFALSQSFARLSDARGTVVVVPLLCFGLMVAAELLHHPVAEPGARDARLRAAAAEDNHGSGAGPWRIGRGAVIGLALAAATLVHPVIGFFGIVTVVVAALLRPHELGPAAFVGGLTAGLIVLPQLATMIGASLPTLALGIGLPVATTIGMAVGIAVDRRENLRRLLVRLAELGRWLVPIALIAAVGVAIGLGGLNLGAASTTISSDVTLILESSGLLLVVLVVTILSRSSGARSPIVIAGIGVGIVALLITGLLPDNLGFLGDALRFEVPKTVHYWLSTIAAVGAAAGLAYLWRTDHLSWAGRVGAAGVFVVIAALPLRPVPIDAYHLGEHRYSETFAIDLHFAGSGFWVGFPNSRTVVDAPRQQILDALRNQIEAGGLPHDAPVLHLARSFQEWVATPLGVFDGVDETFVSLDPEVSHQTVGGRLYGFEKLPGFLASREFTFVVVEPDGIPSDTLAQVTAAGYTPVYANGQGTVYRLGH